MAKKRKAKQPTKEDLPDELIEVTSVKLTSVRAENVLRINAFSLDMDKHGNVVTIQGENESGKTSALKSIEMSIAGASVIPADPIHDDHGEGKVVSRFDIERPVDIDDPSLGVEKFGQLVATREFKRGQKPKLTLRIDGQRHSLASPQTIFEVLMDCIALDPLKFQRMPDAEKQQILAELAGLDLVPINGKRKGLFDERTEVNRDVKRLEAEHGATTFHEDAPKDEVVVAELMAELDRRSKHNAKGSELDTDLANISSRLGGMRSALVEAKEKLAAAAAEIAHAEVAESDTIQKLAEFAPMNEDDVRGQIDDADAINAKVRGNAKHAKTGADYKAALAEADDLTAHIEQLDVDKKQMLVDAESRLPVKGLGFSDEGVVTYKGKPFSQAGKSATAVISCAVSMELNENKMLKVVLIDDAEKMDKKTKRTVAEMAVKKGFRLIEAQVMPDAGPSEGAVVIEDGEVVE